MKNQKGEGRAGFQQTTVTLSAVACNSDSSYSSYSRSGTLLQSMLFVTESRADIRATGARCAQCYYCVTSDTVDDVQRWDNYALMHTSINRRCD